MGSLTRNWGDTPFTSKQIVDISLLCLAKTGVFNDNLKDWNRLPLLDRNWSKFRVYFAKAHREWRANLRLTAVRFCKVDTEL